MKSRSQLPLLLAKAKSQQAVVVPNLARHAACPAMAGNGHWQLKDNLNLSVRKFLGRMRSGRVGKGAEGHDD